MKDQLISTKTAQSAKEKGFDWEVLHFVGVLDSGEIDPDIISMSPATNWNTRTTLISVPTQSLLQRWLREVHNIHIELLLDGYKNLDNDDIVSDEFLCYRAFLYKVGSPVPKPYNDLGAKDYETILEVALQDALELIDNEIK